MRIKGVKYNLEVFEKQRLDQQQHFDRSIPSHQRNIWGQFATPPLLAEAMVRLSKRFHPSGVPIKFLDPALGTGAFFSALLRVFGPDGIESAIAYELDNRLTAISQSLWTGLGLKVTQADFTLADPPENDLQKPNFILCNPPYVRHHHIAPSAKARLKKKTTQLGFNVSGLTGLYAYFLLLADQWMATDAIAVWIIPSEFLDVNYGLVLKKYLCDQVSTIRIHRFEPSNVQFSDALVTSSILVFRKSLSLKEPVHFTSGNDLINPSSERWIARKQLNPEIKWTSYFSERRKIHTGLKKTTLGEIFNIRRGLATGSNKFFLLEESEIESLGIPTRFLRPILPSSRFISSSIIQSDLKGLPIGIPRLFVLDCSLPREAIQKQFPSLENYLIEGESQQVHKLYLPSSRKPWYSQERRPAAPILCTYMGRSKKEGGAFRFIRNYSQATAHNVYLLLYPKGKLELAACRDPKVLDIVFEYLHKIDSFEYLGRVYGGGLKKIEPRELANLEIPFELTEIIQRTAVATDPQQQLYS